MTRNPVSWLCLAVPGCAWLTEEIVAGAGPLRCRSGYRSPLVAAIVSWLVLVGV